MSPLLGNIFCLCSALGISLKISIWNYLISVIHSVISYFRSLLCCKILEKNLRVEEGLV